MSLTNLDFIAIYFPALLILYYNPFFNGDRFRKILLAIASIGLYAIAKPVNILLLVGIIFVNYFMVVLSNKLKTKAYRIIAIVFDASVLLFFKYINKMPSFEIMGFDISQIAFPIGLSYFIFKAISYVVDSEKEKSGNLLDAIIYIGNFLTIVSGPLSRYKDELPSIKVKTKPSMAIAYNGFERIIIGLAKKILIADSLSILVEQCFAYSNISVVMAWVGAVAFTLQIFFDFAGYTDIVIGAGKLLGFDLPENFNYPYMAKSITDFWKRWHISLTKWFTNYIYIPLGGSRVNSTIRHIFNLFVVWIVTGVWHGSGLTFIVWAMIYFVIQVLEKYTKLSEFLNKIHIGRLFALFVIIIEWVIFKSNGLRQAFSYLTSMFGFAGNRFCISEDLVTIVKFIIPLILGIVFSTNIGPKIKKSISNKRLLNIIYNIGLIVLFAICLVVIIGQGYSAPLYAKF